ncbi:MAG: tail fiber assembly protein [Pantoea sp.]|uniref:tail fiber assembly protein n=1 Tax=Pantoea sp. TaxID=69393 RepID=UPI0039E60350
MATYALIKDSLVINTIVWAGPDVAPMDFGDEITYAEIPDGAGNSPSIGWSYDGSSFAAPPLTDEEEEAIQNELIQANISLKAALMAEATEKIEPLQDAVDLGIATDVETTSLTELKTYRVALNRIDANISDTITWPTKPVS